MLNLAATNCPPKRKEGEEDSFLVHLGCPLSPAVGETRDRNAEGGGEGGCVNPSQVSREGVLSSELEKE